MELYTDNNPKTTVKGLGFKDEKIAKYTINKIKKRSIIYQKALINTMYNRAKYHPNINNDMKKAMKIFKKWLKDNSRKTRKYDYLPLDIIKKYEKLAIKYDISRVARGVDKSIKSEYGFLVMYKKVKNYNKLSFIPIFKNKPDGMDYDIFREKFLNARIGQMKAGKIKLYDNNNLPTIQHLVLIMNAYSPDVKGLNDRLKLL